MKLKTNLCLGLSTLLLAGTVAHAQNNQAQSLPRTGTTVQSGTVGSTTMGSTTTQGTTTRRTTVVTGSTVTRADGETLVGIDNVAPLPDMSSNQSASIRTGSMSGGSMSSGSMSTGSMSDGSSSMMTSRRVYRTVRTYRTVPVYRQGRATSTRRVYTSRRMYRTVPVRSAMSMRSGSQTRSRRTFMKTGE